MLTPYIVRDQLDIQRSRSASCASTTSSFARWRSLASAKFDPHLDYHKKRGLVEEINRSIVTVEEDIAAREALARPTGVKAGPVTP